MNDIVQGLLWLLMIPVSCIVTVAVLLLAVWFGSKLRWYR